MVVDTSVEETDNFRGIVSDDDKIDNRPTLNARNFKFGII